MLRKFAFWCMAVLIAPLSARGSADDLVAFSRKKVAQAENIVRARVFSKLDEMALALIRRGGFHDLLSVDPAAILIERDASLENLWIASSDKAADFRCLYETQNFRLLRLTLPEIHRLQASGAMLIKCLDLKLPPDKEIEPALSYFPHPGLVSNLDSLMALVSAESIRCYVQRLQDFQTRYTNTDSFWASSRWIFDRFQSWGYDSLETQEFEWLQDTSRNVIVTKISDVYPDRVIVIGGHFDSVVYDSGDPYIFAPGADDNASGTAMVMEIARILANTPLKKTIRFVTFGAEEQGLLGSQFYVYYALQRGENIELMINADMIGNLADDFWNFNINCNEAGEPYGQVLSQMAAENTALVPQIDVGEFYGSDNYPFDLAGFRTVFSQEGDFSPNWHLPSDIIDNMSIEYMTDVVRSNLGLLYIVAGLPLPVGGLSAANAGDGSTAYLDWTLSPEQDVMGYEVLGGVDRDAIGVMDTAYMPADTISGLNDNSRFYFAVSAIASDGGRSLIAEIVPVDIHSAPSRPDTLVISPELGQLRIEWTSSPDPDFGHYQLWRRVGDSGDYGLYEEIAESPAYLDRGLESDTRYYYYVVVVDTTGLTSEPSRADYSKIISLDSGILLVDETRDGNGSQGQPNDAQQDSFYSYISQNYRVTFHDIVSGGLLRINDIGPYSTIAWMDDDATLHYMADIDEDLATYLSAGGNLLYVGWRAFYDYDSGRPLIFNPGDFPYDFTHVYEVYSTSARDFIGATGQSGWPSLVVRPERVPPTWNGLLLGIDVMELQYPSIPIHTYNSVSGDTLLQGKPVGILIQTSGYNYAHLTFPLYCMGDSSARAVFEMAMELFGEETGIAEDGRTGHMLPAVSLRQNYPNPFNAATFIRFELKRSTRLRLSVYNILGQEVAVLADGVFAAGPHSVTWDSKDSPSAIYFCRLRTDDAPLSRRMVLLK